MRRVSNDPIEVRQGLPERNRLRAAELYLEAFAPKLTPILRPLETGVALLAERLDGESALVAQRGGELLGVLGYQHDGRRFVEIRLRDLGRSYGWLSASWRFALFALLHRSEGPREIHIESVAVAAEARGQGIGTRLVEAAFDLARVRSCIAVTLDVVDTNPDARRFYERLGFAPVREDRLPFLRRLMGFSRATTMMRRLDSKTPTEQVEYFW